MKVDARRRRIYRLTEAGTALLRGALPHWERAQERLHRQLGEEDWSALLAFTERVTMAALAAESAPFRNSRPLPFHDGEGLPLHIQSLQPGSFSISPSATDS